jgi:hypothetical protein
MTYIRFMTVPPAKRPGNFVALNRADSEKLEDSLCREIYNVMESCYEDFQFKNITAAERHFQMRCRIIQLMDRMNSDKSVDPADRIDYNYWNPNPAPNPTPPPDNLPPVPITPPNGGKWQLGTQKFYKDNSVYPHWFELAGTNNPYDALMDAIATNCGVRAECVAAISTCIMAGAAEAIGKTKFNTLHAAPEIFVCGFGRSFDKHTTPVMNQDLGTKGKEKLIPGDRVYFINGDYKKRAGEKGLANYFWQGENALYCGKNGDGNRVFSGLGESRVVESDMINALIGHYMSDVNDNKDLTDGQKAKIGVDRGDSSLNRVKLGVFDLP